MTTLARGILLPLCFLAALLATSGCGREATTSGKAGEPKLTKIRFQTDWYPQAEHGGFYQALAKGYYKDAGLDVEILPGGPGATVPQKVVAGVADLAMTRSDDLMLYVKEGLPFIFVGVFMQHDPQGILLHEESPISTFKQLDGKSVMAVPGTNWERYLKARYQIGFSVIPMNYGIGQFMADKNFVQQCFITNEPYYVRKNGGKPKTLLIADSGYDPYRGIMTTQKFARENPEALRGFVAASVKGWEEFMNGDSTPAKALISQRNDKMDAEFMEFSISSMRDQKLIFGSPEKGELNGLMTRKRLQQQVDLLVELKILPAAMPVENFASFDYLPPALKSRVD